MKKNLLIFLVFGLLGGALGVYYTYFKFQVEYFGENVDVIIIQLPQSYQKNSVFHFEYKGKTFDKLAFRRILENKNVGDILTLKHLKQYPNIFAYQKDDSIIGIIGSLLLFSVSAFVLLNFSRLKWD